MSGLLRSILVSEDDPAFRETLCDLLSDQGYDVRTAADGVQALEVVQTRAVDLLLTDFQMPKLTGLELIRHVRSLRPKLPAILLTSEVSPQLEQAAAEVAVVTVLRKPPSRQHLTGTIRRTLAAG